MKNILLVLAFVVFGIGVTQAEESPTAPKTGGTAVESGQPTKEQKQAMRAEMQGEKDAVLSACSEESKAAGCGDKVVGKGLLKCIHEHKKASKDFKVSEGCKTSMKALKEERRRVKGKK
jgi:hypothetical protein